MKENLYSQGSIWIVVGILLLQIEKAEAFLNSIETLKTNLIAILLQYNASRSGWRPFISSIREQKMHDSALLMQQIEMAVSAGDLNKVKTEILNSQKFNGKKEVGFFKTEEQSQEAGEYGKALKKCMVMVNKFKPNDFSNKVSAASLEITAQFRALVQTQTDKTAVSSPSP